MDELRLRNGAPASKGDTPALAIAQPRWYAVQCLFYRESLAAFHLGRQNFPVFLPRRMKLRCHARKTDTVQVPFFPGYLFVSLDLSRDRWRSINGTYGVASIVMGGDQPAAVPVGIVEALQQSCDEQGIISWEPELKPGQSVRIVAGPFADLVGELDLLDDSGRVRVLLDLLGTRVPASIPRGLVVQADRSF